MKKIIATFVIGLLLAFTVIGVSAETSTTKQSMMKSSQDKMMKHKQRRHHRKMMRKHHRKMMKHHRKMHKGKM